MHSKWDRIISALVTRIKNTSRVSGAKRGRYELIQVTCAEIIMSHFESIWWSFFSHLSLFNWWNILKICRKPVKVEHGCWSLPLASVWRSHHVDYVHHVPYVCTPCTSDVGDIRSAFIQFHICEAVRWLSHTWSGWDVVLTGPSYHMTIQPKGVRIL